MQPLIEEARAKVNLTLRVLGRRADGYHALESLVVFAEGAADRLTLAPGAPTEVVTTGPFGRTIAGANLLAVTLEEVSRAEPRLRLGRVTLEKNLPVAAGIGGGSADAGALLRLVARANPDLAASVDWLKLATRLGADVPVCFRNSITLMWGIGERLIPVPELHALPAVLVNPLQPVPADKTAQVFRRLGAKALEAESAAPAPLPDFADRAAVITYLRAAGNDLEAPAREVVPAIAEVMAALAGSRGCDLARLSGGGPTCFGLFGSWLHAKAAAEAIEAAHSGWWVTATRLVS